MNKKSKPRPLWNIKRENIFLPLAEAIFVDHLGGKDNFETFYAGLTDVEKDLFLGIASKYSSLVKHGDWHVNWEDCNPVIDYFTNSFKIVSLFALIESLSSEKHEDFYEWIKKEEGDVFPINDKSKLKSLYESYKLSYGSIRRCVSFFERLSPARQARLRSGFKLNGEPASDIKVVAQYLYNLRSKFVHECELVLEIASIPVMSRHKSAVTFTDISIPILLQAFEEGVLAYFSSTPPSK
ncbi:hypothetical protein GCM10007386_05090 [Pseudoduganella dura]|nr:hypothetical protein GCM10007386_05090 [Pseudoduganella dura]